MSTATEPIADNSQLSWWAEQLKLGGTVILSDSKTMHEAIRREAAAKSEGGRPASEVHQGTIHYSVTQVSQVDIQGLLCKYLIAKLEDGVQAMYLLVKQVPDAPLDLKLYFESDTFPQGKDRQDFIDEGMTFVFQDFEARAQVAKEITDFSYAAAIQDPNGILFQKKPFGELHGEANLAVPVGERTTIATTIVEYRATNAPADFDYPDLLLVELGGEETGRGGLITVYVGCDASTNEIQIFPPVVA